MEQDNQNVTTNNVRRKRQKREEKLSPLFIMTVVIALVVTIVVAILLSPVIGIKTINVSGNKYLSEQKVIELSGKPIGQNIFLVDKKKIKNWLLSHPYIERAEIDRKFPFTLNIKIKERRSVGVLVNKGIYLQFSDGGLLLSSTDNLDSFRLPIITGLSIKNVPQPGEKITDEAFARALSIVNSMDKELLGSIQEINIKEANNILAYTDNGVEIRIGDDKKIRKRMKALNAIMNQLILTNAVKGKIEYIDMRYGKAPVIKLEGSDASIDLSKFVNEEGMPSAASEAQTIDGTTTPESEETQAQEDTDETNHANNLENQE